MRVTNLPPARFHAAAAVAIAALVAGLNAAPAADLRLRIEGRRVLRGETPFVWRGFTAFSLVKHVAEGREAAAAETLDWAAATGFNVARVLAMVDWAPRWLTPDAGAAALPRLLALAEERRIVVQVVVFAGTRRLMRGATDDEWRAYAARIGSICAAAPNCVVELANENYHHTQDARLTDLSFLRSLRAQIDPSVPVSCGAGPNDAIDNYPQCGDFITLHLDRTRDLWDMVAHKREMERVSAAAGKFVVDNEPVGAGEAFETDRRLTIEAPFFALAAMGRLLGVGSTFHYEDGLGATPPRAAQQAAAAAFIAGSRIAPDDAPLAYVDGESAVRDGAAAGARTFTAETPGETIVLALPPAGSSDTPQVLRFSR